MQIWANRGLALLTPLALAACSSGPADKPPEPVARVELATAQAGRLGASVVLYGVVEPGPGSERTLSAPTEAIVSSIDAPPGTSVGPGTLVVRLSASPQSALDRAKSGSDTVAADNAYARAQRLRADGLMSNAEVEATHATAASADATSNSLSRRAGALALHAPGSGVVDSVLVKPGDLVAAGAPIARIAAGGAMRARFGIDPATLRQMGPGAVIRVEAMSGGAPLGVAVSGVSHVVDPATRLGAVFANVPAATGWSLGEPLKASLQLSGGAAGVTIPYAAVQDDGGQPYVFIVTGGAAHKHEVKLGAQSDDKVLVLSGIAAGDHVVTSGGTALEDGMKVRTGPAPAAKAEKE